MSVFRLFFVGVMAFSAIGCNSSHDVHEIKGASGKFCVPKSHKIGRIPWIPSDIPKGSGFAFSGCWRADLKDDAGCFLPKMVVGGVAESAEDFRGQKWQVFGGESLVKRAIRGQGALLELANRGRAIVASNPHAYWGWFVWRKATPLVGDGSVALDGADELMATCQKKDVILPGTSQTRAAFMCERKVLGKDYALSYSFESKERVPRDVAALDAQMFMQLDRWRCKK